MSPVHGGVVIERLRRHEDPRGAVFEPLDPADLPRQRNVHVVLTRPGHVRGNHYHRRGTETLVVHGPAQVRYRLHDRLHDVEVPDGHVLSFRFPPLVPHAVLNTGTDLGVVVAFRDVEHDPSADDTVRYPLLSPTA